MGEDCTLPLSEEDLLHIARGHAVKRVNRLGVRFCPHLIDDLAQEFCLGALNSLQSEKVRDGRITAVRHYQLRSGTFSVNGFIDWWLRRHNREHLDLDAPDATGKQTVGDSLPSDDEDLAEATAATLDTRLAWEIAETVLGGVRLDVIRLRYGMGLDKRRTGKRLGISEKVVARHERDALQELRDAVKLMRARGRIDDPILAIAPPGEWTADDVWTAVDRLPPDSRDALRMKFGDGLNRAEIAERQGLSSAESSSREIRAIRKLRRVLEAVRLGAPLEEVARGLRRGNSKEDFRNPLESELERSRVLSEIPRLPEELRRVMELHVVEGLGKNATARELGTHRQTVRNQINRAWDEIRERIYAAESPTVSAPWGETMDKESVAKALPRLPEELRAVMEPCLREKIGVNELARRLGWYASTVSKRLRRAWKALREEIYAARAPIDLRGALGCEEGRVMVLRIAG